jgi:hypothetical protein
LNRNNVDREGDSASISAQIKKDRCGGVDRGELANQRMSVAGGRACSGLESGFATDLLFAQPRVNRAPLIPKEARITT